MNPRVSIVIPVHNENGAVTPFLDGLLTCLTIPAEVLVVFDLPDDTTRPYLEEYAARDSRVQPLLNTYGRGPALALRYGVDRARAGVVVVTMADGSDDAAQIEQLVSMVEAGAVVAAASRYSAGGRQVGGPALKSALSRLAGLTLYWLGRVGTRDATNSFKAYDRSFLQAVGIESAGGFEMGLELVAKARRHRLPVREVPTTWTGRVQGESNFRLWAWLPRYLRWYFYAFGPRRTLETTS